VYRIPILNLVDGAEENYFDWMILGSALSFFLNFVRMFFGLLFSLPKGP